jgi:hypothetical protein
MKKCISYLVLLPIVFLSLPACEVYDEDEEYVEDTSFCDEHIQERIERSFYLPVWVMHQDSTPFYAIVYMDIAKYYCSGKKSTEFNLCGNCDNDGYWYSGRAPTFDFANVYDKVVVRIRVPGPDGQEKKVYDEFYYMDVDHLYFGVEKTYHITLPWDAK